MEASKYVGVPHQDAPEEVAVAAAAVYNGNSPPLAKATKVDSLLVNGESDDNSISVTWEKGEVQPSAYRDKWFAIAFIAQLLVVLGVGMMLVGSAFAVGLWAHDVAESEGISIDVDDDVGIGVGARRVVHRQVGFAGARGQNDLADRHAQIRRAVRDRIDLSRRRQAAGGDGGAGGVGIGADVHGLILRCRS